MEYVIGALLFIGIVAAIVGLRRHARQTEPLRNVTECQARLDDINHDLTLANTLLKQAEQRGWAKICRQLGREAKLPALHGMATTPNGDEAGARDLFETAVAKLEEAHGKAEESLELAQALLDNEEEV